MTSLEATHAASLEIFLCFTGANDLVHANHKPKKRQQTAYSFAMLKQGKVINSSLTGFLVS